MRTYIKYLLLPVILICGIVFAGNTGSQEQGKDEKKEPETEKTSRRIGVVVIDAGHGGKDPGAIGLSGVYEKDINLAIAKKLKTLLQTGYEDLEVVMTREDDTFIDLNERGAIANRNGGNLFVSIHSNSKKSEEVEKNGFEIYLLDLGRTEKAVEITRKENLYLRGTLPPGQEKVSTEPPGWVISSVAESSNMKISERLGLILKNEMAKGTKLQNRGVKQDAFIVLYGASMPAVLVECGFLTDPEDEAFLKSEEGQNQIADSIYKSIRYFKYDYDFENALN